MSNKRVYKHQEFVAHTADINSLHLGRKSGQVLATGGDDRKVNIWQIGKPHVLLSLVGHASAIECVAFDYEEELVAAGSSGGTLKLWELEEGKVVRTLTGHKANCRAIDFHPYGEFFASGSADTNVKVWDIRRKTCIQTYQGHTRTVSTVRFSPDGRWLVSGGDDGRVKIWDLTAGKLIKEFADHNGSVTTMDFHPSEFLLATGSSDRTVRFWDLERFEAVGVSDFESTGVRVSLFTPDGSALLSASHDGLKVFKWEPVRVMDAVNCGWQRVSSMVIAADQLVACAHSQACVSVWMCNLAEVAPFNGRDEPLQAVLPVRSTVSSTGVTPAGPAVAAAAAAASSTVGAATTAGSGVSSAAAVPPAPTSAPLARQGSSTAAAARTASAGGARPATAASSGGWNSSNRLTSVPSTSEVDDGTSSESFVVQMAPPAPAHGTSASRASAMSVPAAVPAAPVRSVSSEQPRVRHTAQSAVVVSNGAGAPAPTVVQAPPPAVARGGALSAAAAAAAVSGAAPAQPTTHLVAHARDKPLGIDIGEFAHQGGLLGGTATMRRRAAAERAATSEAEVLDAVMKQSPAMCAILSTRLTNLRAVRTLWARGDVGGAVDRVTSLRDPAVVSDFVHIVSQRSGLLSLDMVVSLLPMMASMMENEFEQYVSAALTGGLLVLRSFGQMVAHSLKAQPTGVDVAMEERLTKCRACHAAFVTIHVHAAQIVGRAGPIGRTAKEYVSLFETTFGAVRGL